jgi:hypothetical protein
MPRAPSQSLSQIEFLPLSDNRVLAVMVVNGRDVQNRIVQLDRYYSADELRRAAGFLNQQFGGKDLSHIRDDIVRELQETGERLNQLMLDAIRVAQQMVNDTSQGTPEYVIAGETNLMEFAELSNVDKLRRLFEAFTAKRDILHLLDQSLRAEGVQIFIGQESGLPRPGRLQPRGRTVHAGPRDGRRAGGHRSDPHGLRPGHPDRAPDGAGARQRLEFPPLASIMCPVTGPARQRQRAGTSPLYLPRQPKHEFDCRRRPSIGRSATPVGRPGGRGRGAQEHPGGRPGARAGASRQLCPRGRGNGQSAQAHRARDRFRAALRRGKLAGDLLEARDSLELGIAAAGDAAGSLTRACRPRCA